MEALINEIPKQSTFTGFLLIILALCLTLIVFLGRMLLAEKDKRLDDQKSINAGITEPIRAVGDAIKENTTQVTRLRDDIENIAEVRRKR
jgi:hypothetical protein